MGKNRKLGGRRKIFAVFKTISRRLGVRINAPGLYQPAAVKTVGTDKNNNRKNYNC